MSTSTLRKLFQVALGTGDTLIYTTPALTTTTVVALFAVNIDTSERTFRLHQVDSGGSIAATNPLFYDQPVSAKRTLRDGGIILEPGQLLRGLCSSASQIVVTGFGITTLESS